jgi:prepilin-type N-terminal cleavage/methylation domain-containing protein
MKLIKNKKGFTLIEIIISIVLASVVGTISMKYVLDIVSLNQAHAQKKDLVDEAKLGMEYLIRELRFAKSTPAISCGTLGGACTVGSSYSAIFFSRGPLLQDSTDPRAVSYSLVSSSIVRAGASSQNIVNNVTGFTINVVETNLFQFTITQSKSTGETYSLQASVRPRGYI